MPRENGLGWNETGTKIKQKHFVSVQRAGFEIYKKLKTKYFWIDDKYHYIDLNSGPGYYSNVIGSPILFLIEATRISR
jgi:hypothetical protein